MKFELFANIAQPVNFEVYEKRLTDGFQNDEYGFGWVGLPEQDLGSILAFGEELKKFESLILIGIGGSSLGLETLVKGLNPQGVAVYIADNLDVRSSKQILNQVDITKTALVVVSKSGRTLETLGNFTFFLQAFSQKLGNQTGDHVFAVTDPKDGALRTLVNQMQIKALPLPSTVGGRFSVLSTAALPLAYAAGVDIQRLLQGAANCKRNILEGKEAAQSARVFASLILEGLEQRRNVTVFMPYGRALGAIGSWFSQLWGESLGKDGRGPTPQPVLGTIDQHSQLQLYAQGPDDKVYVFLQRLDQEKDCFSPVDNWQLPLDSLEGLAYDQAMAHELTGVLASLRDVNRPCVKFSFETVDEYAFGEAFFFFEWATALVGLGMGVDPFNQPGVEQGKNFALSLCGDPKYEHLRSRITELTRPEKTLRW